MNKTLEITTKIGCALMCSFCPQSQVKSAYVGEREFEMEHFKKCLSTVPEEVIIDLSGFAEPLLHHDAGKMALYARAMGHQVRLFTTLVGLNDNKLAELKQCGLSYVRIHVPDVKAMVIADDVWIRLCEIWLRAEIPSTWMSMGDQTQKVAGFLESRGIQVERPDMISRGGNLWKPRHLTGKIHCHAQRWHNNILLPSGAVYACCQDYGLTMPLGNLLHQPYSEIHAQACEYEENHNPPDNSICRSCEWSAPL